MSQIENNINQIVNDAHRKRGKYVIIAPAHKLIIAKEVVNTGWDATKANHSRYNLKRSSVSAWGKSYKNARNKLGGREPTVQECGFNPKPKHMPLLGEFDTKCKAACDALRSAGGAVNKSVLAAIIQTKLETGGARYMLKENGGTIDPQSATLHQSLYRRWNYVKRRATTTRKNISKEEKERRKKEFAKKVNKKIVENNIHRSMVVNFDETSVSAVPSQDYTMNLRGRGTVKIAGRDIKRNVTAITGGALNGNKLGCQVIYGGKTKRCEVYRGAFPANWDVTHTKKHWSTNISKVRYLLNIIVIYMESMRRRYNLSDDAKGLVIFDFHSTNISNPLFYDTLSGSDIYYVIIDAGMTDELQPMDQIVNRKTKMELRRNFDKFYMKQVNEYIDAGGDIESFIIDLRWSIIKNRQAKWLVAAINTITAADIRNSFRICGITGNYQSDEENEAKNEILNEENEETEDSDTGSFNASDIEAEQSESEEEEESYARNHNVNQDADSDDDDVNFDLNYNNINDNHWDYGYETDKSDGNSDSDIQILN